jgi:RHS repeat-associated protein
MTAYAFGLEEHSYFNTGGHKGDLYYYRLGGRLLGALDNTGKTTFYLSDALGSVLASFSNAAGIAAIKGNQVFGPYGNARDPQGTINTAKGYTGQYNDGLTGLDYYGSRYYDQVAGVFLSADIVHGNSSGANPYAYVGGNPETFSDPSGQMFVPPGGGGSPGGVTGGGGSSTSNSLVPLTPPNAVQPVGSALAPTAQNANSCGQFTQADCTPIKWAALTNVSGNVRVRIPLGIDLGGIVCTGVGPCIVSPFASGASIDITVQVSTTTITPLAGCATIASCFHDAQGVDDKPTDDAGALGFGEGACSFSARTVVATNHGEQAISKVKAGEKVWAYNPKTHQMELQPILHVWIHPDNDLVDLTLTTTKQSSRGKLVGQTNEVVHTTSKHPFMTTESGFVPAGRLHIGMHVQRADGGVGIITGWQIVPGVMVMYNLEVAQDHTFTVGDGQWVVHNCDFASMADELAKSLPKAAFKDTHATIAVAFAQDEEGNVSTLVGINSSSLRPWRIGALEGLLDGEGTIVPSAGDRLHAEQNILAYMRANNLELLGIGASRDICLEICAPAILDFSGGNFGVIGTPIQNYDTGEVVRRPE